MLTLSPLVTPLPYSETRKSATAAAAADADAAAAATPNITTTGWDMVKCGLGHAVPNTVIDRPPAPPFDAARAWATARDAKWSPMVAR